MRKLLALVALTAAGLLAQNNTVTMVPDAAHRPVNGTSWTGAGALAKAMAAVPSGASATISVPGGYTDSVTALTVPANVRIDFAQGSQLIRSDVTTWGLTFSAGDVINGLNYSCNSSSVAAWVSGTTYASGTLVQYGTPSVQYKSLMAANTGNIPSAPGSTFWGHWNLGTAGTYNILGENANSAVINNLTVTDCKTDFGVATYNSSSVVFNNPVISSQGAQLSILSNTAAETIGATINGGIITQFPGDPYGSGPVDFVNEGAGGSGWIGIRGGGIIGTTIYNGGTNAAVTVGGFTPATSTVDNITATDVHCYNTSGAAQFGCFSGVNANNYVVKGFRYDFGGFAIGPNLPYEAGPGNNQQFIGNEIHNVSTSASAFEKDGPGSGLVVQGNVFEGTVTIYGQAGQYTASKIIGNDIKIIGPAYVSGVQVFGNSGPTGVIANTLIEGNIITNTGPGSLSGSYSCISAYTFGAPPGFLGGTSINGNKCNGFLSILEDGSGQTGTTMSDNQLGAQWAAATTYFVNDGGFAWTDSIIDSNGHLQMITTAGVSGTTEPCVSTAVTCAVAYWSVAGGTTADGTAVWTDMGLTSECATSACTGVTYRNNIGFQAATGTVTYTAPGAGAITQTVQQKLTEGLSVVDFGAKGDEHVATDCAVNAGSTSLLCSDGNFTVFDSARLATLPIGPFATVGGTYTSGAAVPAGSYGKTCSLSGFNGGGSGATATVMITAIAPITFSGAGLNDMTMYGAVPHAATTQTYVVTVIAGTPDTYSYTINGGSPTGPFPIPAGTLVGLSPPGLNTGITILFAASTGHTSGNTWTITQQDALVTGTGITMLTYGTGFTSAPTSATLGTGTAACTGTATLATSIEQIPIVTTMTYVDSTHMTMGYTPAVLHYSFPGEFGTDDSAAIQAAMVESEATGKKVYFPGAPQTVTGTTTLTGTGRYLVLSQLVHAGGTQTPQCTSLPMTLYGDGSGGTANSVLNLDGSSTLDLRYASGPQFWGQCSGTLTIEHMGFVDYGLDNSPFMLFTNSTPHLHDLSFFTHDAVRVGALSDKDAILLGGPVGAVGNAVTSAFQGYGMVINGIFFDRGVRRGLYGQAFANAIYATGLTFGVNSGANVSAAAFECDGTGFPGQSCIGADIGIPDLENINYFNAVKLESASQIRITAELFDGPGYFLFLNGNNDRIQCICQGAGLAKEWYDPTETTQLTWDDGYRLAYGAAQTSAQMYTPGDRDLSVIAKSTGVISPSASGGLTNLTLPTPVTGLNTENLQNFGSTLLVGGFRMGAILFAQLPASPVNYQVRAVSDLGSNTPGVTAAGGGTSHGLVWYDVNSGLWKVGMGVSHSGTFMVGATAASTTVVTNVTVGSTSCTVLPCTIPTISVMTGTPTIVILPTTATALTP
jgi:hypothetical protein